MWRQKKMKELDDEKDAQLAELKKTKLARAILLVFIINITK